MQTMPFMQLPEQLPKVIRPLRYCEFRVQESQESEVGLCPTFACEQVEKMWFCYTHRKVIVAAIASEDEAHGGGSS